MLKEVFSEQETYDFAYSLAQTAKAGDIFCLCGDLGVGKTVFTKGFAKAVVGVEPDETRNKAIYHHWGFTEYIHTGTETYPDGTIISVEFYGKQL